MWAKVEYQAFPSQQIRKPASVQKKKEKQEGHFYVFYAHHIENNRKNRHDEGNVNPRGGRTQGEMQKKEKEKTFFLCKFRDKKKKI